MATTPPLHSTRERCPNRVIAVFRRPWGVCGGSVCRVRGPPPTTCSPAGGVPRYPATKQQKTNSIFFLPGNIAHLYSRDIRGSGCGGPPGGSPPDPPFGRLEGAAKRPQRGGRGVRRCRSGGRQPPQGQEAANWRLASKVGQSGLDLRGPPPNTVERGARAAQ